MAEERREDNQQPEIDIDALFGRLLEEVENFQLGVANALSSTIDGFRIVGERLKQITTEKVFNVAKLDYDQMFDLVGGGSLGADLNQVEKVKVKDYSNEIVGKALESYKQKLEKATETVKSVSTIFGENLYWGGDFFQQIYKEYDETIRKKLGELFDGLVNQPLRELRRTLDEFLSGVMGLTPATFEVVAERMRVTPAELQETINNIYQKLREGKLIDIREFETIRQLGDYLTAVYNQAREGGGISATDLLGFDPNRQQLPIGVGTEDLQRITRLAELYSRNANNIQVNFEELRRIAQLRETIQRAFEQFGQYSETTQQVEGLLQSGLLEPSKKPIRLDAGKLKEFLERAGVSEEIQRKIFDALEPTYSLLDEVGTIPNIDKDILNLRRNLLGNISEGLGYYQKVGSLASYPVFEQLRDILPSEKLTEVFNKLETTPASLSRLFERFENLYMDTKDPKEFIKGLEKTVEAGYERLIEPFKQLQKAIEDQIIGAGVSPKAIEFLKQGKLDLYNKFIEDFGFQDADKLQKLGEAFTYIDQIVGQLSRVTPELLGAIQSFNLSGREKEIQMRLTGKYPDLQTALNYEILQPIKEGFATFATQLSQFGGMSILFGLTNAVFMASTMFPIESAYQAYSPIIQGIASFTGVPELMNTLTSFAGQIPDLMENLYQQYISIKALTHSETIAKAGVSTALQIARVEPIQYEEVMQIISSMAVYPDLRKLIISPEYQRKVFDIVQYLSTLVPEQGVEGALFALREMFGGQFRSLQMRFNISPEFIAQMAGKTWEDFKKATPEEMINIMWKGLTAIFGGRDIFLEKGASFGIQLSNIVDTLIQALIQPVVMKRTPALETKIYDLVESGKAKELLPNRYEYLVESAKRAGLTSQEDINAYIASRLTGLYATPYGFLGFLGAVFNNLLSNILGKLNIGQTIGNFLLRVSNDILQTFEEYSQKLQEVRTPVQAQKLVVEFVNKLAQDFSAGLSDFQQILNSNALGAIIKQISDLITKAMLTSFQKVMEGIFSATLTTIAQLPNMVVGSVTDSLKGIAGGGLNAFGAIENLSSLLGFGLLMGGKIRPAVGMFGLSSLAGGVSQGNEDPLKFLVDMALLGYGFKNFKVGGWTTPALSREGITNAITRFWEALGTLGRVGLIGGLVGLTSGGIKEAFNVDETSLAGKLLDTAQYGGMLAGVIGGALSLLGLSNPIGWLIAGASSLYFGKEIFNVWFGNRNIKDWSTYYEQLREKLGVKAIQPDIIYSDVLNEFQNIQGYFDAKHDKNLKEYIKAQRALFNLLKDTTEPFQLDILEELYSYAIGELKTTPAELKTELREQTRQFLTNEKELQRLLYDIGREYNLSPETLQQLQSKIQTTVGGSPNILSGLRHIISEFSKSDKAFEKALAQKLQKYYLYIRQFDNYLQQYGQLPELTKSDEYLKRAIYSKFRFETLLQKYVAKIVSADITPDRYMELLEGHGDITTALKEYYRQLKEKFGTETALNKLRDLLQRAVSAKNPIKELIDELRDAGIVLKSLDLKTPDGGLSQLINAYKQFEDARRKVIGVAISKQFEDADKFGLKSISPNQDIKSVVDNYFKNLDAIFKNIQKGLNLVAKYFDFGQLYGWDVTPAVGMFTQLQAQLKQAFSLSTINHAFTNYYNQIVAYLNMTRSFINSLFGNINMAIRLPTMGLVGGDFYQQIMEVISIPRRLAGSLTVFNKLAELLRTLENQFIGQINALTSIMKIGLATGVISSPTQIYSQIYNSLSKLPPQFFLQHPNMLQLYYKSALITGQPLDQVKQTVANVLQHITSNIQHLPQFIGRTYATLKFDTPAVTQNLLSNIQTSSKALASVDFDFVNKLKVGMQTYISNMSERMTKISSQMVQVQANVVNIQTN